MPESRRGDRPALRLSLLGCVVASHLRAIGANRPQYRDGRSAVGLYNGAARMEAAASGHMRGARRAATVAIALVLVTGVLIYSERRSGPAATTIVGVVRATEVRVEPEVDGQLVSISVAKGARVHAGDGLKPKGPSKDNRPGRLAGDRAGLVNRQAPNGLAETAS